MIDIRPFNPKETSDDFWSSYFEFTEAISLEENPDDPLPNREQSIKNQKTDYPHFTTARWLAYNEEKKIVGWAGMGYHQTTASDFDQNGHLGQARVTVAKDFRRRGIGSQLLKQIIHRFLETGYVTLIQTGSDTPSGNAFCAFLGGAKTIEGAENRFYLSEIKWELMEEWRHDGKTRSPNSTLEQYQIIPDDIIEEFTTLYSDLLNQQPLGEMESRAKITPDSWREDTEIRRKLGTQHHILLTKEADGGISGLTDIFYNPSNPHCLQQGLTGVRPEFRGRGLGKWLKAEMIMFIRRVFPDVKYISTGNADINAPMLSINTRMGYKRYKRGTGYKFKVEKLAKRLQIG